MQIAIIVSKFNPTVTQGLLEGAKVALLENGVQKNAIEVFNAPGAFELPLIAKKLAQTGRYDGVVCLGAVIKGETAHFEYISLATATGIQRAALDTGVPVAFGVLTTFDDAQAISRSKPGPENKGREAALACIDSIAIIKNI